MSRIIRLIAASFPCLATTLPVHADTLIGRIVKVTEQTSIPCRSGKVCTGQRGGRFCFRESGTKKYLPRAESSAKAMNRTWIDQAQRS